MVEPQAATQSSDDDRGQDDHGQEAKAKRPKKPKKVAAEPQLTVSDVYDSFSMNRDIEVMVRCVFGDRPTAQTVAYYTDLITRQVQAALDGGADIAAAHGSGKQAMLDDFLSNRAVRGALRDAKNDRDMETIRNGSPSSEDPLDCIYESLETDV